MTIWLTKQTLLLQKASFVDFQSYENYIPTFQLFMQSIVKEANIFLNENGSDTFVWDGLVWLPGNWNWKVKVRNPHVQEILELLVILLLSFILINMFYLFVKQCCYLW